MKKYILIYLLISSVCILKAQSIGEMAPEKQPEVFPPNAFGGDIIFCEGGIGLGGFYHKQLNGDFTFFTDISFSESKDEKEIEYYDYWGNPYTIGKKNRVFFVPLDFGFQYRLFKEEIRDNLRPYINFGVGPAIAITTPYETEFFSAFGKAQKKFAAGGYVGIGANFGLDKSTLVGFNIRYYYYGFFDEGVESLEGRYNKNIGGVFITINIGKMY